MSDCPFCARIAAAEYDFSDEHAVAFEPLNPVTEGHLLVVPREHVANAGAHPLAASRTMALAAQIAGALEWADSYNLITSAGAAATQTVPHLHIHLVPRRPGDGLALPWTGQAPRADVAGEIARAIEQSVCEPGEQCAERFCPDCTRYRQAQADAATARKIGEHGGRRRRTSAGREAWDKHFGDGRDD